MPTGSTLMASSNTTPKRRSKSNSRRKAHAQKKKSARKQPIHLAEGKVFQRRVSPFIYLVRLTIAIFGGSTILATSLSVINPPIQAPIHRSTTVTRSYE